MVREVSVDADLCVPFVSRRRQKTAESSEQAAAAAARSLEQCARSQSPYLILTAGTSTALITASI